MDKSQIQACIKKLNDKLQLMEFKGEVWLYGDAVMCLVLRCPPQHQRCRRTVFKLRKAVKRVVEACHLKSDWLNDAVKSYVVEHLQRVLFNSSNL